MDKLEFFKRMKNSCSALIEILENGGENDTLTTSDLSDMKNDLIVYSGIIADMENGKDDEYLQATYKDFYLNNLMIFNTL